MLNNSTNHPETTSSDGDSDLIPASFASRTLITIAERRKGIDGARCRLALLHCETATLLHRSLRRVGGVLVAQGSGLTGHEDVASGTGR